ncbi:hypothetical protein AB0L67_39325 [Streptomyces flaveolus]|uniref:hypothetical protein n=1 Tax=Streptomyces flaveolus TaxID=67297 RepID=UPI00341CCBDB
MLNPRLPARIRRTLIDRASNTDTLAAHFTRRRGYTTLTGILDCPRPQPPTARATPRLRA